MEAQVGQSIWNTFMSIKCNTTAQCADPLHSHQRIHMETGTRLVAIDGTRSILQATRALETRRFAYSVYGHPGEILRLPWVLGYNGERAEPLTGHHLLGNGYRAYSPTLMRFNSPDGWSPFGRGGVNAYGYCNGDPTNKADPTGHIGLLQRMRVYLGIENRSLISSANPVYEPMGNTLRPTKRDTPPSSEVPSPVTNGAASQPPPLPTRSPPATPTSLNSSGEHIYISIDSDAYPLGHTPTDTPRVIRIVKFPHYEHVTIMDQSGNIRTQNREINREPA
jgi:RHS repeat-associated protein